jgi:hypothetical protein
MKGRLAAEEERSVGQSLVSRPARLRPRESSGRLGGQLQRDNTPRGAQMCRRRRVGWGWNAW